MLSWLLLATVPTLTLGKDLRTKTVMAERDAKLCKPAPALITKGDEKPVLAADGISYRVTVENPTDRPIEVCLSHFSSVLRPLMAVTLQASSGLEQGQRMPEVYPIPHEKVPFETLTLPAHTRLAIDQRTLIPRRSYEKAKDLKLKWSVIVNHESQSGSVALVP
jgi:hypothetical protein